MDSTYTTIAVLANALTGTICQLPRASRFAKLASHLVSLVLGTLLIVPVVTPPLSCTNICIPLPILQTALASVPHSITQHKTSFASPAFLPAWLVPRPLHALHA